MPAGTIRVSSTDCHALVDDTSPESSRAIIVVFAALRYSRMMRVVSGIVSAPERTELFNANACVPAAIVAANAETSIS